jgi:nonsense-mediated mRNA decay protein 3
MWRLKNVGVLPWIGLCRLCCLCGVQTMPNPSNMCVNCIKSQVDITEGIQKQVSILWCKECNRYLQPPKHWLRAELESKELLTFCIKRLKGLQKVRFPDFYAAVSYMNVC